MTMMMNAQQQNKSMDSLFSSPKTLKSPLAMDFGSNGAVSSVGASLMTGGGAEPFSGNTATLNAECVSSAVAPPYSASSDMNGGASFDGGDGTGNFQARAGGPSGNTLVFRDQVNALGNWFLSWNPCEQTVALYSLLKRLPPIQAKFLFHVLQQGPSPTQDLDLNLLEQQANNPVYLQSLNERLSITCSAFKSADFPAGGCPCHVINHCTSMTSQSCNCCNNGQGCGFCCTLDILEELLQLLPLLKPGNQDAKAIYLNLLPQMLPQALTPPFSSSSTTALASHLVSLEASRQLLSYSLIHPAMTSDERASLALWLRHFEEKVQYNPPIAPQQQHQQLSSFTNPYSSDSAANLSSNHPDVAGLYPGSESRGGTPWSASERSSFDHDSSGFGAGPLSGPLSADSHLHRHFTFNEPITNSSMTSMIHDPGYSSSATPNLLGSTRSFFSQSIHGEETNEKTDNEEFPTSIRKTRRRSNSLTPPSSTPTSPQFQEEWPPFNSQSSTRVDLTSSGTVISIASQLTSLNDGRNIAPPPLTPGMNRNNSNSNNFLHSRCTRSNSFPTEADPDGMSMGRCGPGGSSFFQSRHAPLSPQSSIASSEGGDGDSAKNNSGGRHTFSEPMSGMKDVPSWLKSLRLHKYAHLFSQLNYEQMLNLNEEQLENQGVTKGARHKICLSISKLRERPDQLRQMEKDIIEGKALRQALNDLKQIVASPIKFYERKDKESPSAITSNVSDSSSGPSTSTSATASDASGTSVASVAKDSNMSDERNFDRISQKGEDSLDSMPAPLSPTYENGLLSAVDDLDLPSMITRVLGKACTQLLVAPGKPDEEGISLYINLLDKTLTHEAFNNTQKKRLNSWKQQIMKIWRPIGVSHRRGELNKTHRPNWPFRHSSTYSSLLSSESDSLSGIAPPFGVGGGSSASHSMSPMTPSATPTASAASTAAASPAASNAHLLLSSHHNSFYTAGPQTAAAFAAAAAAGLPQTNYAAAAAAAALMNRGASHPLLMQSSIDSHNSMPSSRSLGAPSQKQQQQPRQPQLTSPPYLAAQMKTGRMTGKFLFGPDTTSSPTCCSTPDGDFSSLTNVGGDYPWTDPGDVTSQLNRNHSTNGIFIQRQNAFDKTHSAVTRTQSAPGDAIPNKERTVSRAPIVVGALIGSGGNGGGSVGNNKCAEAIFDIDTRLESLALSMTEHALSGPDNSNRNGPV